MFVIKNNFMFFFFFPKKALVVNSPKWDIYRRYLLYTDIPSINFEDIRYYLFVSFIMFLTNCIFKAIIVLFYLKKEKLNKDQQN